MRPIFETLINCVVLPISSATFNSRNFIITKPFHAIYQSSAARRIRALCIFTMQVENKRNFRYHISLVIADIQIDNILLMKSLVFIVEDNPIQQKILQVHFEEMLGNYQVKTFLNPDDMFAHFDEKPFAIVLDHFFNDKKDKTGLDYLREIRNGWRGSL